MFNNESLLFKEQNKMEEKIDVDIYKQYIGNDFIEELKVLAKPLENRTWVNVNSTAIGGGVAEMLQSVIPFATDLGIDCMWYVLEGNDDFFGVTKKYHNMLQGIDMDITLDEIFKTYFDVVYDNFMSEKIYGDLVVIHDPQPAIGILTGNIIGNTLWRCHIDTSHANLYIWRFLLPYINHYDGAIFTCPEFVKSGLKLPLYEISPCINPLIEKNTSYTKKEAKDILSKLADKYNIDISRPIVLAVSRYDIHKNQKTIINAFKSIKDDSEVKKEKPILIIVGNSASDDPEGQEMYEDILKEIDNDPDIYPLVNIENNDKNIGALMRVSRCFVHVSTKEGFGLVVTEAMWQKTPIIGSAIGGIKKQVIDGVNGYLVDPYDLKTISEKIKFLVLNKIERETMAVNAREYVKQNFLLPSLVKKYVLLMRYYLEIDKYPPYFRMNEVSFKEIKRAFYSRKRWFFSKEEISKYVKGNK